MGALDPALQLALAGRGGRGGREGAWEKVEECAKSFPDSVEFLQTGWSSFSRDRDNVDRIPVQYQNDYLDLVF